MTGTAPESRRRRRGGTVQRCPRRSRGARRPHAGEAVIARVGSRRGRHPSELAAACLLAASLADIGAASAQDATPATGWYTAAQATSGQQLFNNYCAECHRPDLTGADGPALKGAAFLKTFGGQPLSDLYGVEHTTMPAVNPGSLPDTTLQPITAFILQQNGFVAGEAPLDETTLSRTLPSAP